MKRLCIVYNQPLSQVQGINYVNNSFVMGRKYFLERGIDLSEIYAPDGVFDCTTHDRLTTIGANQGTSAYKRERLLRRFMHVILSKNTYLGASIKVYFNYTRNSQKAVKFLKKSNREYDYIIFQDAGSAAAYYNSRDRNQYTKTVLIFHVSKDPQEQFSRSFPGLFRHKSYVDRSRKRLNNTIEQADKIVYLSNSAVGCSPVPVDKKAFVYNGVEDISNWSLTHSSEITRFVCVASVTEHKGQAIIIDALSLLPKDILDKVCLTLVGAGNAFDECRNKVKEYGLDKHVKMLGSRNDVAEILTTQDVFVLPSRSEGMPMSILEAMRQGLYIMATPVGGIPEMIEPMYGEFISREPEELSKAIIEVVSRHKASDEAKILCRRRYEKDFSLRTMINGYADILSSL